MTLIVEDGSCVVGAESYATVTDADTYLLARGMTIWNNLQVEEKEQALRRATDYMRQTYRGRWKGARRQYTQALEWPRQGVVINDDESFVRDKAFVYSVPYNTVPNEVKYACIELALRAAAGPLLDDLSQGVKTKVVGPVKIEYDVNSARHKTYSAIDRLLAPLMVDVSSANNFSIKMGRC